MNPEGGESPSVTQQTLSDDELISPSIKPEFYDPDLDEKDELWIQKRRKGQYSDAVLSCPACFTTLCLECQSTRKSNLCLELPVGSSSSDINILDITAATSFSEIFSAIILLLIKEYGVYNNIDLDFVLVHEASAITTLMHEKYVTQYRAIFVINCKIKGDQVSQPGSLKRKRVRRGKGTGPADAGSGRGESLRQVGCAVCSTEVGVIDEDEAHPLPLHLTILNDDDRRCNTCLPAAHMEAGKGRQLLAKLPFGFGYRAAVAAHAQ
ncbi:hypothetical protein RJ640_003890 [Escallonia rubra]|uniref:E2F-associated phosphoprotein n=1 Tax=Escallonia rubra TaxID=112253 RepID=A0AA88U606_9ASTE|nr:hypothetical protein RJ640_003890 [Escallonia rubra]